MIRTTYIVRYATNLVFYNKYRNSRRIHYPYIMIKVFHEIQELCHQGHIQEWLKIKEIYLIYEISIHHYIFS